MSTSSYFISHPDDGDGVGQHHGDVLLARGEEVQVHDHELEAVQLALRHVHGLGGDDDLAGAVLVVEAEHLLVGVDVLPLLEADPALLLLREVEVRLAREAMDVPEFF